MIEYAVVLAVVALAVVGMQTFVARGLKARQRDAVQVLTSVTGDPTGSGTTLATTNQYEPYTSSSSLTTDSHRNATEDLKSGGVFSRTGIDEQTTRTGSTSVKGAGDMDEDDAWQ